jgi:hypothetical protein
MAGVLITLYLKIQTSLSPSKVSLRHAATFDAFPLNIELCDSDLDFLPRPLRAVLV